MSSLGRLGKLAVTAPYNKPAAGHVWFLHGTCDTGPGLQSWVKEIIHRDFNFYKHKIYYPSAPLAKYDLLGGKVAGVWFNRLRISPDLPEDHNSIQRTATVLRNLIATKAKADGVPMSRVIIGGFSQGGTMALHLAYRIMPQIAGCFVLSSFIPEDSKVYEALDKINPRGKKDEKVLSPVKHKPSGTTPSYILPGSKLASKPLTIPAFAAAILPPPTSILDSLSLPNAKDIMSNYSYLGKKANKSNVPRLFMSQGMRDPLVLYPWARSTFMKLRDYGVQGTFYSFPKTAHFIHPLQLHLLHNWIDETLRDDNDDRVDSSSNGLPPGSKNSNYGFTNKL